nr:helix-turn-helix transcriptional regulator [Kocuria subflava]
MRRRTTAGGRRRSTLTEREQEVAELVARGLTNAQVAQELGLGRRTVEGHVYRLFDKLGISQRSEVQEALQG